MENDKTYLMHCVNLILGAHKDTVKILRENPMSNVKLIERSGKCLKDPNPLSSAMANMSLKYPISIDRAKAKQYGVPETYLDSKEDMHYHGRILCKKEAIDWWVDYSPDLTEGQKHAIDILMEGHRDEVKSYYSIDWSQGRIEWSKPNIERRRVPTRSVLLHVDPKLREQLVAQTLMPDHVIPYFTITRSMKDKMDSILKLKLIDKSSIGTQVRMLLNQMDPRVRTLPVLAGLNEHKARIKHCIMGPNHSISGLDLKVLGTANEDAQKMESFCKRVRKMYMDGKITIGEIPKMCRLTQYKEQRVLETIQNGDLKEGNNVKWVRVALGLKINSEIINERGVHFSPQIKKLIPETRENLGGLKFFVYNGEETVNFKNQMCRGNFIHDGQYIIKIAMNYTDYETFIETLAEIAGFCRWNMEATRSRGYLEAREELIAMALREPYKIIRIKPEQWNGLVKTLNKGNLAKAGVLEIKNPSNVEYVVSNFLSPKITFHGDIVSETTSQVLVMPKVKVDRMLLTEDFKTSHSALSEYVNFKDLISQKVEFYRMNYWVMLDKIMNGNFRWGNETITELISATNSHMSGCCKYLIMSTRESPDMVLYCFWYCFSGCDIPTATRESMSYNFIVSNFRFNLLGLGNSNFLFKSGFGVPSYYTLFGVNIGESMSPVRRRTLEEPILGGYRIKKYENAPIAKYSDLIRDKSKIRQGEVFGVYIRGVLYELVRDSHYSFEVDATFSRQVNAIGKWNLHCDEPIQQLLNRKRKLVGREDEELKRPRYQEVSLDENFEIGADVDDLE
uniref:Putative polymerase PB2 n=1 Tax=Soybean thrips quaranja-like virus 1 TaxID=2796550 RepID=A0A7T3UYM4_9ORTO|nr:putative polymerase PB2 [Soybean thrips quaranja-like virus 1]